MIRSLYRRRGGPAASKTLGMSDSGYSQTIDAIHQNFDLMSQCVKDSEQSAAINFMHFGKNSQQLH